MGASVRIRVHCHPPPYGDHREGCGRGRRNFVYAKHLFREFPDVDLFVCGDNHKSFGVEDGGRHVVNCGSLMRGGASTRRTTGPSSTSTTRIRGGSPPLPEGRKAADVLT